VAESTVRVQYKDQSIQSVYSTRTNQYSPCTVQGPINKCLLGKQSVFIVWIIPNINPLCGKMQKFLKLQQLVHMDIFELQMANQE